MNCITRTFSLFVALAMIALGSLPAIAQSPRPRNVVLYVTDDQSPDFGAYGNKVLKSPNLDALAADGTRYTLAFATTASCSCVARRWSAAS